MPNAEYQTEVDQVWFAAEVFPRPQTGARPEVAITITSHDPSGDWQPQFYDNFLVEPVMVGDLQATRISGTNKEMLREEQVVILELQPGVFLQIAPNGDPLSLQYFEQMLASFQP